MMVPMASCTSSKKMINFEDEIILTDPVDFVKIWEEENDEQ